MASCQCAQIQPHDYEQQRAAPQPKIMHLIVKIHSFVVLQRRGCSPTIKGDMKVNQ